MLWTALTTGIVMCQIAVSHYVPPCPLMAINRHRNGGAGMSASDAVDGSHQRIAMCQNAVVISELLEGEPPMSEVAT